MELQMLNLKVLVCGLAIGSMGLSAMAQSEKPAGKPPAANQPGTERGPRGERPEPLSAEKAKAAWDLEATGVAKRLALKDDQTKSLVAAYDSARTSHQAATEKLRKEQQEKNKGIDRQDREAMQDAMQANRKAMEDLNKSETEKFTKAVTTAIPGDSGAKAAKALSVFGFAPQWDRLVDTVGGFKLDAAKQQDALNALETFASEQTKNMATMADDREGAMEDMKTAREKLTTSLKTVLSEDQMKKVEQNMGGGRMGGGRRGGNGGGKGGGG
jgi:hypothetical protein